MKGGICFTSKQYELWNTLRHLCVKIVYLHVCFPEDFKYLLELKQITGFTVNLWN